ncbi:peptide-methionine (S)-S-oxide reductase [Halobacteriovorax marinus]|uniref:Peptide methionine sulfoxide reductase MsrA n=1 Tax=Halobacteriovorax marinus TaxID=97084 RepID=A0A1Y5FHY5_9BACT|nr:peptide-methionine (S)-S-oxide reductase [Halobacteriovorax marinus]
MKFIKFAILLSLVFGTQVTGAEKLKKATFAGGCFWCMEPPFEKLDGVKSAISGYAGGSVVNPTYRQVSAGSTGHTEVVQITYDPSIVSYKTLLATFWRNIDPTDAHGQFVDKGSHYRPAVFFHDKMQQSEALASKADLQKKKIFEKDIVVEVTPLKKFYPAEDYHQDYYKKSSIRYKFYRYNSGRDKFLNKYWKK